MAKKHEDHGVLGPKDDADAPEGVLAGNSTGGGVTEKGAEPGVPQGGSKVGEADPGEVIRNQV